MLIEQNAMNKRRERDLAVIVNVGQAASHTQFFGASQLPVFEW